MHSKKNWLIVITCCLSIFVISFFGTAQAESLAELQEKAVNNRKLVEKYRVSVQKGEEDVKISQSRFSPSFDINYTANSLDNDTTFENSENSYFTASLSYNIFSGFKHRYDLKSAELIKKSKDYELESMIQGIKYLVAVRYLDIYGKKNSLKVAEDEYNLLKKRHEDTESRHKVGLIRRNDLLKIKVELDDAEQGLKKARAELTKSTNLLEFETDSDIDAGSLNFNEFKNLPKVQDFSFYESLMLEKKNEIKALETVLHATRYSAKSAESAFYPSVDASAGYKRAGDNYLLGVDSDNDDEIRVQLSLNMNIFDGSRKYAAVRKAGMEVKSVEYDLYELRNDLATELENILLDYGVALKNLKVAESSISQAEENLRITDISFKEGVETAADVLDAIFYLSRAKYNFINARNEVFLYYYKLVRITDDF
ncbi:MAG: TolC family protein [Desulfobacteraceae bacterium]|nr:TolC family protein [Desulfobacteraceae bacterium]